MIFNLLFNLVVLVFGVLFVFLPEVGISSIPLIGDQAYYYLALAVSYWNTGVSIFPPARIVWTVFVWVVIPFEILLLLAKVFLGSRTPAHMN